ncbi:MAG TPA: hypothetical protein VFO89_15765 [Thermoanaerobaculia bacterium]|nr:hypothetical protein [Thermoanaerobaculia bacterium]
MTLSIIDWSDPDEMVGLLCDYIRSEMHDEIHDRSRAHFLHELARDLETLVSGSEASGRETEYRLREICESQPSEFRSDPAIRHLEDCVAELHRISAQESPN